MELSQVKVKHTDVDEDVYEENGAEVECDRKAILAKQGGKYRYV